MLSIKTDFPLKDYSSFKIGGKASYFADVFSNDELLEAIKKWNDISKDFPEEKQKVFALGDGTNILFSDKGFGGLVIKNSMAGIQKTQNGIKVGAGEQIHKILEFCMENALSGLEWAGGLPGTIGGAVRGNAGAFKGEIKDSVLAVQSIRISDLLEIKRDSQECEFGYRSSIFKTEENYEIIVSIDLKLSDGNKEEIRKLTQEKVDYRNQKHPMDLPNIGSTFKNIKFENLSENQKNELSQYVKDDPFPVVPVAKLLYLCGVKGKREGDAQISEKHPNFIVNLGNAKYQDVLKLIRFAKDAVRQKFNINLEEEIMYVD